MRSSQQLPPHRCDHSSAHPPLPSHLPPHVSSPLTHQQQLTFPHRWQAHTLPYYGPTLGDACSGLWPLPRSYNCSGDLTPNKKPETSGSIGMDEDHFQFVADNPAAKGSARLKRAFDRFHGHIFNPLRPHPQLSTPQPQLAPAEGAPLFTLDVELGSANETLGLGDDESYSLSIETTVGWGSIGRLSAPTIWGALHGLESFSQLTTRTVGKTGSVTINSAYVFIDDVPRFPWRGIMIDTSRHWHPLASIRSMIDGISFNRMNVLHWHITDMQSFPLKTKSYPKLADGAYGGAGSALHYDADDVKAIVAYAKDRGVRVVPEIDTPVST